MQGYGSIVMPSLASSVLVKQKIDSRLSVKLTFSS
jgi:hypothetical protein